MKKGRKWSDQSKTLLAILVKNNVQPFEINDTWSVSEAVYQGADAVYMRFHVYSLGHSL